MSEIKHSVALWCWTFEV